MSRIITSIVSFAILTSSVDPLSSNIGGLIDDESGTRTFTVNTWDEYVEYYPRLRASAVPNDSTLVRAMLPIEPVAVDASMWTTTEEPYE